MRLSLHFTLSELTKSQTATRCRIDNSPPEPVIEKLRYLAQNILEPVRDEFNTPFTPSSGYRCRALNRKIGSSSKSQHCYGEAVDFEIPGIGNLIVASWIKANLDFDQLILEFFKIGEPNSGWIHCSLKETGNRNEALIYDGSIYKFF